MRTICQTLAVSALLASCLFAGAMVLEIGNPSANPEAQAKYAVLVARLTACHSPEKTILTAEAEGLVNGARTSIPLKVIPLSAAGTFAVAREWPAEGSWVVKLIASNPEYKDYVSATLVPVEKDRLQWTGIKRYYHGPTDREVADMLGGGTGKLARQ
jgi:hypothetical protein